jgi:LacI family transcriptional regulator
VVIATSRMNDSALVTLARELTVVLLNRTVPGVSCVVADTGRGTRAAVEHLAALGHRTVLYLAGPATSWSDGVRWRAVSASGRELGLRIHRLGPHEPTFASGVRAAGRLRQTGATAVVAYNDNMAAGAMKGLRAEGVAVPTDVSILGFDNIIFDELIEPALTTVAAPLYRMGATGVQNCIALARGAQPTGKSLVMPVKLIGRDSTGPVSLARKRDSVSVEPT